MPYKPNERLYRSFSASNFQPVESTLPEFSNEERDAEPSYKVRGYYTVWGAEYKLRESMPSMDLPAEYEKVDRNALVGADLSDVLFQENHSGSPLARIRNGSLKLGTDDHGAWCEAYLGGCQRGRELYESIVNGLITEMSFGFTIADDENGYGAYSTRGDNGEYHTTITRISKIFDVSGVGLAASEYTEISEMRCRSAAAAQIEAERSAERRAAEEAEQRRLDEQRAAEEAAAKEEERKLAMVALRAKAMRVRSI